jgi:hypothetical protein
MIKLFTPYPRQRAFMDKFLETEDLFGVVVAPRGSGKTLLGVNLMLYWLLSKGNQKGGWVSPTYSQAKSVFDTIVKSSKAIITSSNRMETSITFLNGSTLKFLSSDSPDSIRGFRFNYLILDEVAFMKELTIEQAILPTLNPSGKKCLMISTPKGKNHFYRWFLKDDIVKERFPLTDCPYVSPVLIEQARKSLPPTLFRQEFEGQFEDAANDVFIGTDSVSIVTQFEQTGRVFAGIDTGLNQDMSVLTLINEVGRVVWVESLNNTSLTAVADTFVKVLNRYTVLGGYIETNGVGRGMYDLVNPYHKRIKPWTMSQDNKTDLVRKLITDIEELTIELPTEGLLPQLHTEMANYTYKLSQNGKVSFTHAPGQHDDYIDSLMLANYSRIAFMDKKPMKVRGLNKPGNLKPSFGSYMPT